MTYWQKECTALAVVFTLVLVTLIFGGMLNDVSPRVYLGVGALWCVVAAVILMSRGMFLQARFARKRGCLCASCGYEFLHDDEVLCPDCGAQRDIPVRVRHDDCRDN